MMNFFTQFSTKVDYGEREFCTEPLLQHGAEYQEYLSCDAPFLPGGNPERLTVFGSQKAKNQP
ncbi:MAG: hypothetical protein WAK61_13070 [Leclercia sp.]